MKVVTLIGVAAILVGGGAGFVGARLTTPVKIHTQIEHVKYVPDDCTDALDRADEALHQASRALGAAQKMSDAADDEDLSKMLLGAQEMSDANDKLTAIGDSYGDSKALCQAAASDAQ